MPDFSYRSTVPITTAPLRRAANEHLKAVLDHLEAYGLNLIEVHFDFGDSYVYLTLRGPVRIPADHLDHLGIEQAP